MRSIAAIAVVLCLAGAAFAQPQPPPRPPEDGRFHAEWERTSRNFARYYPEAAMQASVPGMASVCCIPRPDRTLDCRVAEEFPQGRGFGEATLRTAREFRMTQESYERFQSDPRNWMQMTMRWVLPDEPGGNDIAQRPERAGLCRPANGFGTPIS